MYIWYISTLFKNEYGKENLSLDFRHKKTWDKTYLSEEIKHDHSMSKTHENMYGFKLLLSIVLFFASAVSGGRVSIPLFA